MKPPFSNHRIIPIALIASFLLVAWHTYNTSFYARIRSIPTDSAPTKSQDTTCKPNPGLHDILVILKTGATESQTKLPVHFETTLRCVPNWIIYSDFNEEVSGHEIHDALDDDQINPATKQQNPDFELYNRLQRDGRAALNPTDLDSWAKAANTASGNIGNPAWRLDKWKFLPIVDKALLHAPEAKWFVFAEADTYISWPALTTWLSRFSAEEALYLGNQMQIGDTVFGHGGSGFVVSGPAMRLASRRRAAHRDEYDDLTARHWAGDCVLGEVLNDAGVPLRWSWPNLVGDFGRLDYGDESWGKRLWCHKVVSHHHMSPQDIRELWDFEQQWYDRTSDLLSHKDLFENFILPHLPSQRQNWDNLSKTPVSPPLKNQSIDTFEACGEACDFQPDCLQYQFSEENGCRVSNVTLAGQPSSSSSKEEEEEGDGKKVERSGWKLDRIREFFARLEGCDGDGWA